MQPAVWAIVRYGGNSASGFDDQRGGSRLRTIDKLSAPAQLMRLGPPPSDDDLPGQSLPRRRSL